MDNLSEADQYGGNSKHCTNWKPLLKREYTDYLELSTLLNILKQRLIKGVACLFNLKMKNLEKTCDQSPL